MESSQLQLLRASLDQLRVTWDRVQSGASLSEVESLLGLRFEGLHGEVWDGGLRDFSAWLGPPEFPHRFKLAVTVDPRTLVVVSKDRVPLLESIDEYLERLARYGCSQEGRYRCRICGYLWELPFGPGPHSVEYSICDCCGAEVGVHDTSPSAVSKWRSAWLLLGARWFEPAFRPVDWDLPKQLETVAPDEARELLRIQGSEPLSKSGDR